MKRFSPLLFIAIIALLLLPSAALADEDTHTHTHCICGTGKLNVGGHTHEHLQTWEGITSLENLSGGGTTTLKMM